ncbi:MBL fold metallo-hydrolase [Streptomyces roseus]|uniref:MBL fold metallo-hydrolase n=1 Tax=Streptomyces roseus TaxID=66430 RepID=UPI00340939AC
MKRQAKERVGSTGPGVATVSYVHDAGRHVIFDPGMVARHEDILVPLAELGLGPEDITDVVLSHRQGPGTLLAGTGTGVVAFAGDLWWHADGPAEDPVASDREVHRASRLRVLAVADLIVPGHGSPFRADDSTPR